MKIIIWGHYPLHTSTHGYIHDTYYKTFKSLGHDVMWVSNEPHNLDYTDAIFFVEDSQKSHMPLRKDCKYITHHVNTEYFTDRGVPYENVLKLGNCIRNTVHFEKSKTSVTGMNQPELSIRLGVLTSSPKKSMLMTM